MTPLHLAAANGQPIYFDSLCDKTIIGSEHFAEVLLKNGANTDVRASDVFTPLGMSLYNRKLNAKSIKLATKIDYRTIFSGNNNVVKLLRKYGAVLTS